MNNDRFEERIREAARDYHQPPETPRQEMWTAIEARRRRRAAPRIFILQPAWRWGLSMAAVLLVGLAIGLWLRPESQGSVPASGLATRSDLAYGVAAVQYLNRTETLLTGFRADARAGRVDTLFIVGGRTSSNTTKLYEVSRKILSRTYFIENARQITPGMLRGAERVGVSGGASTPPEAIREAVEAIRQSIKPTAARESMCHD
jgi:hypothetical protein